MFPLLRHLVVVVFIIALLNIGLLKVNTRNSDINWNLSHQEMGCVVFLDMLKQNFSLLTSYVIVNWVKPFK